MMRNRKKPENYAESFNRLPPELFREIGRFLEKPDVLAARLACKRFGLFLAAATADKQIPPLLINYRESQKQGECNFEFAPEAATTNEKGDTYAVMYADQIHLVDAASGEIRETLEDEPNNQVPLFRHVAKICYILQESCLFTLKARLNSNDERVFELKIWDLTTKEIKHEYSCNTQVDIHPQGFCIGVRKKDDEIELFKYDVITEDDTVLVPNLPGVNFDRIKGISFSTDYQKIVCMDDQKVFIYNLVDASFKIIDDQNPRRAALFDFHVSKNYLLQPHYIKDMGAQSILLIGYDMYHLDTLAMTELSLGNTKHSLNRPMRLIPCSNDSDLVCIQYMGLSLALKWPPLAPGYSFQIWNCRTGKKLQTLDINPKNADANFLTFLLNVELNKNKLVLSTQEGVHAYELPVTTRLEIKDLQDCEVLEETGRKGFWRRS